MKSPKFLTLFLALCSLMGLVGCGFSNGGSTQTTTTTTVNVPSNFAVTVTPATATVAKGSTTTLTANVTAQGGFSDDVQLALFGLPSGVTATFSSSTVSGSGAPTISVAASDSAASGTYTLTLSGTSGATTHNTSFSLAVTGTGITPDFSISTNPNQQAIGVGGTETFSVTVIALNDYMETVNLTASGLPSGMTASFSPASITGSGISTLTITTDSTAVAGTSTLTVSGAGNTVSHSVTVGVTVTTTAPPPDFSLTVAPTTQTIAVGDSTSVAVSVTPTNGFTGTVALAESGMPAGMDASCSPASITTSGSCTLNISTNSSAVAGTYILTVTGTSGTLSHSGAVTIVVTPTVLTPDFSMSATPSSQTVIAGSSTTYTASVAALNSFTGVVTMSASGLPTGVTASFAPATVTGSGSSTLTLTSTSSTAAGTYFVSLTGTSGTLVHSMNVALTVTVTPPDFTLTVEPSSQTVATGESTSVAVSVAPTNGFTGTVALVESGIPAGMDAACTPGSITTTGNIAGSCTLNISTNTAIAAGTYTLTVTGTSGGLSHSGAVSIVVTPRVLTPDFAVSASPSLQTIKAGSSTTYTASVAALNSFTGVVTMSASGLPTGVAASFVPTTVTGSGSSTVTLTSTSSTAAGTYSVTLTGTDGALVHSMNVALTVTPAQSNYTTCTDKLGISQLAPNWQSPLFISNYQTAIQALVAHYTGNRNVGYIRIGLGRGGEINLPDGWDDSTSGACYDAYTTKWGYTIGGSSTGSSTWNTYLATMVGFESPLSTQTLPLLVSITPVNGSGYETDDFIAPLAVQNGLSYGNQGLQASDITNFAGGGMCGADWCNLFATVPPQISELQTLGQSCPTGTTCVDSLSTSTGTLEPLLPFAVARGANDIELYYADWLIAYDPNDPNHAAFGASYSAAIQTASASATMQVLFPDPTNPDIATYLMTNPAVTGAVISVDWSDIEPNAAGSFDWTITDAAIAPWIAAGKKVNLVLQNLTYGGANTCPSSGNGSHGVTGTDNCAMPAWMWTVLQ